MRYTSEIMTFVSSKKEGFNILQAKQTQKHAFIFCKLNKVKKVQFLNDKNLKKMNFYLQATKYQKKHTRI